MTKRQLYFRIFCILSDYLILVAGFNLAFYIRFYGGIFPIEQISQLPFFKFSLIISFFGILAIENTNINNVKRNFDNIDIFFFVVKAMIVTTILSIITSLLVKNQLSMGGEIYFSRFIIVSSFVINLVFLSLSHRIYREVIYYFRKKGIGLIKVLIVGIGKVEREFLKVITENDFGYKAVGILVENKNDIPKKGKLSKYILGTLSDIEKIVTCRNVDEIILANPTVSKEGVLKIRRTCDKLNVSLSIIPNIYGIMTNAMDVYELEDIPLFRIEDKILLKFNKILKRSLDLVIAFLFVLVFSPVYIIISILIKLDSRGPVIFKQQRLGLDRKEFNIYKFRTMIKHAEKMKKDLEKYNEAVGPLFKIRNDPRITRMGKILRKYSLDELPQFFNVLKGDMSLVGPRPSLSDEAKKYKGWQLKRYEIKPGITGLPQISGRSDLPFNKVIELDIFYMENWSIWLDLKVLIKTLPIVLSGKGAY